MLEGVSDTLTSPRNYPECQKAYFIIYLRTSMAEGETVVNAITAPAHARLLPSDTQTSVVSRRRATAVSHQRRFFTRLESLPQKRFFAKPSRKPQQRSWIPSLPLFPPVRRTLPVRKGLLFIPQTHYAFVILLLNTRIPVSSSPSSPPLSLPIPRLRTPHLLFVSSFSLSFIL